MTFDEAVEAQERRHKQMMAWIRNPKVRQWRRILFLLREEGEPMHTQVIADAMQTSHGTIYKVLQKMKISSSVNEIKEKNKGKVMLMWKLTPYGHRELRRHQKNKIIPTFQV